MIIVEYSKAYPSTHIFAFPVRKFNISKIKNKSAYLETKHDLYIKSHLQNKKKKTIVLFIFLIILPIILKG